jgi:hypothetical protein
MNHQWFMAWKPAEPKTHKSCKRETAGTNARASCAWPTICRGLAFLHSHPSLYLFRVLFYVASAIKQQFVAKDPRLECMHAKENKIDDISHMQY